MSVCKGAKDPRGADLCLLNQRFSRFMRFV
jgi:hypothetical protein